MAAALDVLTGAAIEPALPDIARLRIAVFRDFPYLYDGSLDYEREYLSAFAAAPGAVIVAVRDGGRIVGASTGLPLAAEHAAFRDPVARAASMSVRFFTAPSRSCCRITAAAAWALPSSMFGRPMPAPWACASRAFAR